MSSTIVADHSSTYQYRERNEFSINFFHTSVIRRCGIMKIIGLSSLQSQQRSVSGNRSFFTFGNSMKQSYYLAFSSDFVMAVDDSLRSEFRIDSHFSRVVSFVGHHHCFNKQFLGSTYFCQAVKASANLCQTTWSSSFQYEFESRVWEKEIL